MDLPLDATLRIGVGNAGGIHGPVPGFIRVSPQDWRRGGALIWVNQQADRRPRP